jgi:hypothetical protein
VEGGWRCGGWSVGEHADGFVLRPAHAPSGLPDDGLDGLRALCVAHWSAHPDGSPVPPVHPSGDGAAGLLAQWGLDVDHSGARA